jgi:hypothetical protein
MYTIVCQISIAEELCVTPWTIWEFPTMDFLTVVVDEFHGAGTCEVGK